MTLKDNAPCVEVAGPGTGNLYLMKEQKDTRGG